ncbi:23S rRNA (guanosine(2251)-2'-O)-methyltransferase RlmB [uncultured Rikenella sp.]|uniref:23S rRNA (guanosine(2251)-2'-O)-methyltransferase RlmB n=1 Tax=uncultured Rikenella sp. TaxID=368003 RepID=UPI0025ED64A0|nr:23S rRNA (guanosine(2251)-2'-O)-methyltransferase RlmB [uncultured Rikenella sp.]
MAFDNENPSTKKSFYRRPADAEPRGDSRPQRQAGRPAPKAAPKKERKEREERAPENVIFGIHPVREAIEAGTEIEKIYFRKTAGETLAAAERAHVGAANALREQALEAGLHIQEVPVEKLNRLTRNGNHQGVAAVVAAISYKDINELAEELETKIAAGETPLVMLMDSVTDVRNFGAIARSAECAGAAALIMPAKNSAPVNAEAIKSSAGALTLIPVCRAGSLKGAIALLKGIGMQCVAATEKSNTLVYEVDFTKPTVIVMGAEDKGISREVLRLCDVEAGIPLVGRIESLNVSAAAAVILFEAQRQRFERQ